MVQAMSPPSRVNAEQQDLNTINHTSRPRRGPYYHHNHTQHQPDHHHYEVLHPRGLQLLQQQQQGARVLVPGIHNALVVPEGTPPPPWPRPLPPLPWGHTETDADTDITSSTDVDSCSSLGLAEDTPPHFTSAVATCSCHCHHRDQPPCYSCCERGDHHEPEGPPLSCSGESLYTLPYSIPYTTCHTWKSWGNSTLDVRLPRKNNPCVKFESSTLDIKKQKLATENEDDNKFWWLANLEENLAWGVFVFHLGVIPFLLVYSGRVVYCFILPIFFLFCGWVVVRRRRDVDHQCQTLVKLVLSVSCLLLAITVSELMNCHMPQDTWPAIALSVVILAAFPTGYLICKKDDLTC